MPDMIDLKLLESYKNATPTQLKTLKARGSHVYDLSLIESEPVREEYRKFLTNRCEVCAITTLASDIPKYRVITKFLNATKELAAGITARSWEEIEIKCKAYLYRNNYQMYQNHARNAEGRISTQSSDKLSYLHLFYRYTALQKETVPEEQKDVWDLRKFDFDMKYNPVAKRYCVDFRPITQGKLKEDTKRILYHHCHEKSVTSVKDELRAVKRFSMFLRKQYPKIQRFDQLNRDIIEDYLVFMKTETNLAKASYGKEICRLAGVLSDLSLEQGKPHLGQLFLQGDMKLTTRPLPRAYLDSDIKRFNQLLKNLDPQLARCLLLHQLLGTRIQDVLLLKTDCLFQKKEHDFIRIAQHKTNAYTKPVSAQIVALLQKAIAVTKEQFPDSAYIFVRADGRLFTYAYLQYHVKALIRKENLTGEDGEPFQFLSHRFRHTYGSKLTEQNLDDASIARLLGHKSIASVSYYRKMGDLKLAEETKEARAIMEDFLALYREEKERYEQI